MKLTRQAIKRLQRAKEQILTEPAQVNMDLGITAGEYARNHETVHHPARTCGTVGCIAGWLVMNHTEGGGLAVLQQNTGRGDQRFIPWFRVEEQADRLLGVEDSFDTQDLFYAYSWPRDMYLKLQAHRPGTLEYAQVVGERIDQFIEEHREK